MYAFPVRVLVGPQQEKRPLAGMEPCSGGGGEPNPRGGSQGQAAGGGHHGGELSPGSDRILLRLTGSLLSPGFAQAKAHFGRPSGAHLRHDVGAGRAVPTAVAHFYLVQVAGALGEVAQLGEMPAGG